MQLHQAAKSTFREYCGVVFNLHAAERTRHRLIVRVVDERQNACENSNAVGVTSWELSNQAKSFRHHHDLDLAMGSAEVCEGSPPVSS